MVDPNLPQIPKATYVSHNAGKGFSNAVEQAEMDACGGYAKNSGHLSPRTPSHWLVTVMTGCLGQAQQVDSDHVT
jgi:hypothetical protein